jgi:DNA-binding transcriptional MerR regulator
LVSLTDHTTDCPLNNNSASWLQRIVIGPSAAPSGNKHAPRKCESSGWISAGGKAMNVSELAKEARISPHVVRFYARTGLLEPSRNPSNGYKVFGQNEVKRLRFIRMAQCLGYSLAEIAELLRHLEDGERPLDLMEKILRERLVENQEKIELYVKRQALMERALRHLESRTWGTANMDGLCDQIQRLVAESRA